MRHSSALSMSETLIKRAGSLYRGPRFLTITATLDNGTAVVRKSNGASHIIARGGHRNLLSPFK